MKTETTLSILGLALMLIGYSLLYIYVGWQCALALFLIEWSRNMDRKDTIRKFLKGELV